MERKSHSYLQLIKPGITLSNSLAAAAGYFLAASTQGFVLSIFAGVIGGVALVVASACVVNNVLDRNIDRRMKRTSQREIAKGAIGVRQALLFAAVLGLTGFLLLWVYTNTLTLWLGALAFFWYVAVYGVAKRTTPFSTIIGTVCGALPPVAGYVAVAGAIDTAAIFLFLLLIFWQLPHFYAIAIFRRDDYKHARLPIWSVNYSVGSTKAQILFFAAVFALTTPWLTVFGYTGFIFCLVMAAMSAFWVVQGIRGYRQDADIMWSKRMFGISLLVLLVMCGAIALGGYLP